VLDSQGLLRFFEQQHIVTGRDFEEDIERGMLAGTPEYMAPEQISDPDRAPGDQRTDTTADVYSLGVVFYELLTGRKLYPMTLTATDPKAIQREVLDLLQDRLALTDDDLDQPSEVPDALWTIIRKTLRRDPSHRQGSAVELAADIELYLDTGRGVFEDENDLAPTIRGGMPDFDSSQVAAVLQGVQHIRVMRPDSDTVQDPSLPEEELPAATTLSVVPGKPPSDSGAGVDTVRDRIPAGVWGAGPAEDMVFPPEAGSRDERRLGSPLLWIVLGVAAGAGVTIAVLYAAGTLG
jgi:serine/threonine protein kinase